MTKINDITEAFQVACVWLPLSDCLPWVDVFDQYLLFCSNAASESGHFQSHFLAKLFSRQTDAHNNNFNKYVSDSTKHLVIVSKLLPMIY